jgi:hypothetical protein
MEASKWDFCYSSNGNAQIYFFATHGNPIPVNSIIEDRAFMQSRFWDKKH